MSAPLVDGYAVIGLALAAFASGMNISLLAITQERKIWRAAALVATVIISIIYILRLLRWV